MFTFEVSEANNPIKIMTHIIEGKEINIDWDQKEMIDNHGSGCSDWIVEGEDESGNKYFGCGNYQSGELIDVNEIEHL